MAQHRQPSRTARRVAAVGASTAAALALTAGPAAAGDERCEENHGVTVCVPADVNVPVDDLNLEVLTEHVEYLTPPVHLGP